MRNEIERKSFIKEMPDLSCIQPIKYERYFLEAEDGKEIRISNVNNAYFYEEKEVISSLERTREKKEIEKEEFDNLKQKGSEVILRDRYNISTNPDIAIQIYHGRFEGLVRVEVEFDSEREATSFIPFSWMGEEMTDLPIARDSGLINLTPEAFHKYLK